MYGTQTEVWEERQKVKFENDVKMYGTQTDLLGRNRTLSLRMM